MACVSNLASALCFPGAPDAITSDPACTPALALLAVVFGTLKTVAGFRKAREGLRLQEGGSSQNKGVAGHEEGGEMEERKGGPGEDRDLASLVAQLTFRIALLNLIDVLHSFHPSQGAKAGHVMRDALQEAIDALGTIKEGGKETVEEEKVEASGESGSVAFAFDRGITRALKGNAPRRVIHIPSLSQAFLVYRTLLDDLGKTLAAFAFDVNFEVEKEATGTERAFSLQRLRMFLDAFAAASPGIIARSFLHQHLVKEDEDLLLGRFPFSLALAEHMQGVGLPVSVVCSPQSQAFLLTAAKTLAEALRNLCHNKARQRTRLEVLFQDLGVLEEQAEISDADFRAAHQRPVRGPRRRDDDAKWGRGGRGGRGVGMGTGGKGLQILTSLENQRIELEKLRRQATAAASSDKEKQGKKESKSGTGTGKGRGGGGKKKQKNKGAKGTGENKGEEEAVEGGPTIRPDDDALAETQIALSIHRLLARGGHLALTGLGRARGSWPIEIPRARAAIRFHHRFKAFAPLRYPALMTYDDFQAVHDKRREEGDEEGASLTNAKECFKAVKTLVEHGVRIKSHLQDEEGKVNLKNLARAAISNSVALVQAEASLREGGEKGGNRIGKEDSRNGLKKEEIRGAGVEGKEIERPRKHAEVTLSFVAHPQVPVLVVKVME
ncbi:hypothetical protein NGA_0426800 [Nannochloropsis gaditana CCMP526]|uniref:uncharacterized protein n=1 Tax=Nannochloropsis gaditana (strain CCMP526) TaxID=1093141 RepID=UPI00029F6309|nr:hypothetical protein NGA_0426800 [Nannochloropsis gaditana CCMP526]EKU22294.1 hypothetical protein NGA_0426800 [Nannochloropsis gaditana CCMP526]|eukprot:XP_005854064.1 hypothetical protein NGA_0426800 [Nannochloropsis gaditana CCMP526]